MKDDKKLVTGQEAISQEQLDRALVGPNMLTAVAARARRKMETELETHGLIIDPDSGGVYVRVVVECIAVPRG